MEIRFYHKNGVGSRYMYCASIANRDLRNIKMVSFYNEYTERAFSASFSQRRRRRQSRPTPSQCQTESEILLLEISTRHGNVAGSTCIYSASTARRNLKKVRLASVCKTFNKTCFWGNSLPGASSWRGRSRGGAKPI